MKSKFEVSNISLLKLNDTLTEKNPYMVIALSSTGLDNNQFRGHQPTRLCVQEYVYDETSHTYVKGITFDRLVKCSEEALKAAIDNIDNYDVFMHSGIDKDAYIRGENVLEPDAFKKELEAFISGAAKDTLFIANSKTFVLDMLEKIDCREIIGVKDDEKQLLDQPAVTKAFFAEHGINSKKNTLEALKNFLDREPLDKAVSIIGVDNRVDVISKFCVYQGREIHALASEQETEVDRLVAAYEKDLSDMGKQAYKDATFEQKLRTLEKTSGLSEKLLDRNYECDLNKLYDLFDGNSGAKGVIIMQCSTTGFSAGDVPIQFTAMACQLDRENCRLASPVTFSIDIQADNRSLAKARDEIEKGKFDAFSYTGINREAYEKGLTTKPDGSINERKRISTETNALKHINDFFEKYPPSDYIIITNGKAYKDNAHSFSQKALSHLGNLNVVDEPFIDFTQVIKEYSYVSYFSDAYEKNVLIDPAKGLETFSLADVVKNADMSLGTGHTYSKCAVVGEFVSKLAKQHYAMELGKDVYEQIKARMEEQAKEAVPEPPAPPIPIKVEQPAPIQTQPLVRNTSISDRTPTYKDANYEGEDSGKYMTEKEYFTAQGYTDAVKGAEETEQPIDQEKELALDNKGIDEIDRRMASIIESGSKEAEQPVAEQPKEETKEEPKREERRPIEGEFTPPRRRPAETARNNFLHRERSIERPERSRPAPAERAEAKPETRPAPAEQPVAQKTEPAVREQSSPVMSADMAALIAAMNGQTAAIKAQSDVILAQNAMLMQTVIEQSSRIEKISSALVQSLSTVIDIVAEKENVKTRDRLDPEQGVDVIERLESIKEEIAAIRNEDIPQTSKGLLQTANELISKGQINITREENQRNEENQKAIK